MTISSIIQAFRGPGGLFRALAPLLALSAFFICNAIGIWHPAWLWLNVIFLPLVLLGIRDATQQQHSLMRNYPIAAHIRWIFEALRPYLRAYIVENDLEGRPFSMDQRQTIYERAKGDEDSHPFGTELDVYASEYQWMVHSIAPAQKPVTPPRVLIGGPQCSQPYAASIFNISAMSFGSLSAKAIEALNLGAARGGFYHDTGEGSISPYHRKHGGDLVWELGSGYFGCRDRQGHFDPARFRDAAADPQVKMVEIKLSQGAKPGHGGVLPGPKVSQEIAETRGVPAGQDCISPAGHSAFRTPKELIAFAAGLRDLSGGKPVGIKLCVGHPHEVMAIMKAMIVTGVYLDFIVVDGAEGGTGAAPIELSDHAGMPLTEGLIFMRNALVGSGLKDVIRLGASGKIYSGEGIAGACAMGADWANAARPFMFALGCVQSMRCHLDTCPTGIATQDLGRQRGLVVEDKAQRVARFHHKTVDAAMGLASVVGVDSLADLRPHHLYHRVTPTEAQTIDRIYPFIGRGDLLEAPDATPYGRWWAVADADSFRPLAGG